MTLILTRPSGGALRRRRGTTVVEMAIVAPAVILVLIGMVVGTLGVFRMNQVALLAHEGARWASVHGTRYQEQTGQPAVTAADVYANAIQPHMVGLDPDRLFYEVSWNADRTTASVTVRYQWLPEAFYAATTFSNTSTMLVTY